MDIPSNKVTGKFYVRVGGVLLPLSGDATLKNLGGIERKPVIGNEVHGFQEEPVAVEVELSIVDKGVVDIKTLASIVNATITVETDRGDVYTIPNAWAATAGELSSKGEIKMTFNAVTCEKG
jgi:hypothetical protein